MANRGRKAKPGPLSLLKGGPHPEIPRREGKIEPPKKLPITQQRIWDDYIEPAWWLQQGDALLCYIFVNLMSEYIQSPKDMISTRIAELRRSMGELHLTSSERARLGIDVRQPSPLDEYFSD